MPKGTELVQDDILGVCLALSPVHHSPAFFPGLLSLLSGAGRCSQLGLLESPKLLGLQSLPGDSGHAKLFSFL